MSEVEKEFTWTGRVDSEETKGLAYRLHEIIEPFSNQTNALALVGFCSDEGVRRNKGRIGAKDSPNILRKALANLPWLASKNIVDAGNITCTNNNLEKAHIALANQVKQCLDHSNLPIVLGGGHEVAYGSWLGMINHYKSTSDSTLPSIGIINLDAHFDLRKDNNGASSGTPFYQISNDCQRSDIPFNYCCLGVSDISNTEALFKRAEQLNVSYRRDSEMGINKINETISQLNEFINSIDVIYLTIDLDVLPASVMPGVSAPAAKGVDLIVIEEIINTITQSKKLKLADIAEYNANYDIDNCSARVAARLFHLITK